MYSCLTQWPGEIVRILVLRAAAQPLVPGVVRIPQVDRHGAEAALFRVLDGLIQRHDD